jgi:hypothetical protein
LIVKVAVTDLALSIVIVVVAEELVMLPDQPAKVHPDAGVAESVTTVPLR